jgi:zinc protease
MMTSARQYRLSNGLPVVFQHYEGGVAATYWWVQAGSADEKDDEAGFAHFLEHMLFKDATARETGRASTGQMARLIESFGGEVNAYTSFDQTVFHVTCAAHHWESVLDIFGGMSARQRFLREDFEREREVILEEVRKNTDSPERKLFDELFKMTFRRHPYGRPVIGNKRSLEKARVGDLESFYRRNYCAERMGLVLVGPIEGREERLLKLLEKRFGAINKGPEKTEPRPVEPAFRAGAPASKLLALDIASPTLSVSFRAPDLRHPDVPALDLLAGILGMGEMARLYQSLFYKKSIATDVRGGLYVPRDPGMIFFQIETAETEQMPAAAAMLAEEIERIKNDGPTNEELARMLANAESERLYATQTADSMAGRLGFLAFILGDLDFDRTYLDQLRSVDAARIREVAKRYLDPRRMSVGLAVPLAQKNFALDSVVSPLAGLNKMVETPIKRKKPGVFADLRMERLSSGARVLIRPHAQSHVVSVHGVVLGGLRLEAQRDWGASSMLAMTWTKGTRGRDARAIASFVEGRAAGIDGFSGRNTVGLQLSGLARDWNDLSSLFSEVLLEPSFPEDEIEHSRRVAEDSIRSIDDHSAQLCSKLFLSTLFEQHPYGRFTTGSLESIAGINSVTLRDYHNSWLRPERLVLSVSGAVEEAALQAWLKELDNGLARLSGDGGLALPQVEAEPLLKGPRWVEKHLGREQVHIIVGGNGITLDSKDRLGLRLLQTILAGQSGRLFVELREKKSLAYAVSTLSFEGIEPGYLGTYIACSPEKRHEAVDGIKKVLEDFAKRGPRVAEMKRAQEYFLGRRAMDLQGDTSVAAHLGLEAVYGLPFVDEAELAKKVRAVSAREIQRLCRKYLVEASMVTSVVG